MKIPRRDDALDQMAAKSPEVAAAVARYRRCRANMRRAQNRVQRCVDMRRSQELQEFWALRRTEAWAGIVAAFGAACR